MGHQYKYISGKEIIARAAVGFSLDSSQWIFTAPLDIADGLAQLKIPQTLQYMVSEGVVEGYKCELPCNIKLLIAVEYNGRRLRRIGSFNNINTDMLANKGYNTEEGYELRGDNWITTTFPEGTILFHFRIPPVEYDKVNNLYIPKVPDDAYVIESLKWYLVLQLLYKGYKHPTFNLSDNNEFTNPGLQWEKNKRRARNSVNIIDADEREAISKLSRSFFQNYNTYDNVSFNSGISNTGGGELTLMESITGNYNSTIIENVLTANRYIRNINNESTATILAATHKLGTNVIPVFFELIDGKYVKTITEFIVDLNGNVTWNGSSVVANGYIILV